MRERERAEGFVFCSCLWIWEENCAPWRLSPLAGGRRNIFLPASNGNAKEKEKKKKEIFSSFLEAKRPKKSFYETPRYTTTKGKPKEQKKGPGFFQFT